jgi:Flp pilus assembly protein TadG
MRKLLKTAAIATTRRLGAAQAGTAAIEFALCATIFTVLLANVVDGARMLWSQMQVDNAAQMGGQAAFNTCVSQPGTLPATTNCSNLSSKVTQAVQSTSLGTAVTVSSTSENYQCAAAGPPPTFTKTTAVTNPPPSCAGGSTAGDYLTITVSYNFTNWTALSAFPSSAITSSATERLQ